MKFNIGDRVKCIGVFDGKLEAVGKNGTVTAVYGSDSSGVSVEFDEYMNGHGGSMVMGKPGYCWNFYHDAEKYLEPINTGAKILITTDGTTTTARLYDGKKVTKSAEAKCSPDDKFDFGTGAKLAFERLMGTEKPKEHKPESIKLYCVKEYLPGEWVTRGTIYIEDKDGIVSYDDGYCDNTEGNFSDGISAAPGHLVPLVSRPAQTGEWVLITEPQKVPINEDGTPSYQKGSVLKIIKGDTFGLASFKEGRDVTGQFYNLYDAEYEVLDGYDGRYEEPEKPKGWSGKVVCVDDDGSQFVTAGKIYSFVDGWSKDNMGDKLFSAPMESLDEINRRVGAKFIEFKGEADAK